MNDLRVDFEKEWDKFINEIPEEALPMIMSLKPQFLRFYGNGQIKALDNVQKKMKD